MKWSKEIPEKPGYYFMKIGSKTIMVEVVLSRVNNGDKNYSDIKYFMFGETYVHETFYLEAQWLGPIESRDIK